MGVPGWLLKLVIAFLSDRKMLVRYKGQQSSIKSVPGGGPQGTLLALLLFLVLINDLGFEGQVNNAGDIITSKRNMKIANQIHLKYVDDMTLAEAVDLPKQLVSVPASQRPQPDNYHARTGHSLPMTSSKVFQQLVKTKEYAEQNSMKINYKKTKVMIFNPCTKTDFMPELILDDHELEVVDEIRLLGVIIRSDLKWIANTANIVSKAIILGSEYLSYRSALRSLNLETLESRRVKLTLKFGLKSEKHEKFKKWFTPATKAYSTRLEKFKYCSVRAKHTRFQKSPLSFLTKLLNMHHRVKK